MKLFVSWNEPREGLLCPSPRVLAAVGVVFGDLVLVVVFQVTLPLVKGWEDDSDFLTCSFLEIFGWVGSARRLLTRSQVMFS